MQNTRRNLEFGDARKADFEALSDRVWGMPGPLRRIPFLRRATRCWSSMGSDVNEELPATPWQ